MKSENLKIKQLTTNHLDLILELQNEIFKENNNNEKLLNSPKEILESYFEEKGFILGIFDDVELIGFSRIWFPNMDEISENYKSVLKLNKEDISQTAFFRGSCIKKEYRGQKLQKKLYENAINVLIYMGFKYITGKVKMENIPAIKNLVELNFKNEGMVIKNNEEYFIFIKKIK